MRYMVVFGRDGFEGSDNVFLYYFVEGYADTLPAAKAMRKTSVDVVIEVASGRICQSKDWLFDKELSGEPSYATKAQEHNLRLAKDFVATNHFHPEEEDAARDEREVRLEQRERALDEVGPRANRED